MEKVYDKAVRDKIPEIILKAGESPVYRSLSDEQYLQYLNLKIAEEYQEYMRSGDIEELADLQEVLSRIVELKGYSQEVFQQIREKKNTERGAFTKNVVLEKVISD